MANRSIKKERTKFISFYVCEEEKRAITDAARRNDMSISDYCRRVLMAAVSDNKEVVEII